MSEATVDERETTTRLPSTMSRDGYAIVVSSIGTAGLGVLGWIVAARMLPPAEVGRASGVMNAVLLLSGLAQLNLSAGLHRYAARAGAGAARLVAWVYVVVTAASLVIACGYVIFSPMSNERHVFGAYAVPLFIASVVLWALFQLQDQVLTALGRATWMPMENLLYSGARLVLIIVLTPALAGAGVVVATMSPIIVALLVLSFLLVRRVFPGFRSMPSVLPTLAVARRYLLSNWVASIALTVQSFALPLIALQRAGAATAAVFFIVWTIALNVDLVSGGFAVSLVVRASSDQDRLTAHLRAATRRIVMLIVPGTVLAAVLAPLILGVFGSTYAEQGSLALRMLLAAAAVRTVAIIFIALRQAQGRGGSVAVVQTVNVLGTLLIGLLVPTGSPQVFMYWFAALFLLLQLMVAVVCLPTVVRALRVEGGVR